MGLRQEGFCVLPKIVSPATLKKAYGEKILFTEEENRFWRGGKIKYL